MIRVITTPADLPEPRRGLAAAILAWVVLLGWSATLPGEQPLILVMVGYWPALGALLLVAGILRR